MKNTLSLLKKRAMQYLKISDGVIGDDFIIVIFSQLNNKLRNIASLALKTVQDNDYVIYSPNGDTINVLGRFSVDTKHISASRYFQSFIDNSQAFGGINPALYLRKASCLHITNCVFDISLNNKQYLNRIFNHIIRYNTISPDFLWMDDADLLFYSIKDDLQKSSATHYFALMLYNIENAPV